MSTAWHHLSPFVRGYIECALWSSTDNSRDDGGDPLDENFDYPDLDPECVATMIADCEAFQEANESDLEGLDPEQCGRDFWLTRNGHGAGFWDRGLGPVGDRLSKACKPYGSADLYVGDDGRIHHA